MVGPTANVIPGPPPRPSDRVAAVILPYAVFLVLLLGTWNRWMEPFVDSGRELMVPSRVAGGETLYRDIHFHHGPLAPWSGAVIERIAGRSLAARTAFAAAIALAALESLRRLCGRWLPPIEGALAAALAVAAAFFLRPGGWLFPFSFDTAIAVAAILAASSLLAGKASPIRDALAVSSIFAALLARPELGVAAAAAAALDAKRPRRILILAVAPLAAAGAVYAFVSRGVRFEKLIQDGWLALLRPPAAFQNVYRAYAGLDRPGFRTLELALAAIVVVLLAAYLAAAAAISRRSRAAELAALILLAAIAWPLHFPPEAWAPTLSLVPPLVRVLPPVVFAAALVRVVSRLRRRPSFEWAPAISDGALLMAVLFAARLALAAGYSGPYNAFFLPLPLAVSLAALGTGVRRWTPTVGAALPRLVAAAITGFVVFRTAAVVAAHRGPGWETVETPAGSVILPSVEASTSRLVLSDLARRLPARGATLSGVPEAGFFEYVLGAANPLPLEQFWPGHIDPAGERRIAEILARHPPDAFLFINALAVGEGARAFGRDYSPALGAFLDSRFVPAATYGPSPRPGMRIGDPDFFIQVRVPR